MKKRTKIKYLTVKDGQYFYEGKRISNFTFASLKTTFKADKLKRFVRFKGSKKDIEITPSEAAFPMQFREFCLSHGDYVWIGGYRELMYLWMDLRSARATAT